jgi:hypothetical protein
MEYPMKIRTLVFAALAGSAAIVATVDTASAYVVCNSYGDCWRTRERYSYQPSWGLKIYDDNWRWRDRDRARYRWRDYNRGYYGRGGVWITF